jgi:hypothetical protein
MQEPSSRLWLHDLLTLLCAREIIIRLQSNGLDAAINVIRAALAAEQSRRQYLREALPDGLAYAIPGRDETFVMELSSGRRCAHWDCSRPLLRQILDLERELGEHVVKVIHEDGRRQWTYCL